MTEKIFLKIRLYFTAVIIIAVWSLLFWDYFHGGVPSHHILQRKDLPEFSNWWGGLLLPLLTWYLLYRIQKRAWNDSKISQFSTNILYAFIAALSFGLLLSLFFTLHYTEIPFYMIIGLLLFALFFPIYRAECFLGFVLGMTFTFGGVLPVAIIAILSLIGALLYLIVRPGILAVKSVVVNYIFSKKYKITDYKNKK